MSENKTLNKLTSEALKTNSRTQLGLCKNEGCENERRDHSAYCQPCSDKHNGKSK